MHKMKSLICVLFVFAFVVPSITFAIEFKKDGFSISLPNEWEEIPRDVINAHNVDLSKAAPNLPVQHTDYVFQLASSEDWFEFPNVSITIQRTGRLTENQMEKLVGDSFQEDFDKLKGELGSILSNLQSGKMIYDRQHRIIWTRLDADVAEVGPVSGISGMVFTEMGFIQVTGISLKRDYPIYEGVFKSVILSVFPVPELAYKSKWSDSLPSFITDIDWGKATAKSLGGFLSIAIIALIIALLRKKSGETPSSEQAKQQLSSLAVFSLVLCVFPYAGLPMAIWAVRKISKSEGRLYGKKLAWVSVVANCIVLVWFVWGPFDMFTSK